MNRLGIPCLPTGMRRACPRGFVVQTQNRSGKQFTINPPKEKTVKHKPEVFFRNSINGQRVTQTYANKHPETTERQIVYRPSPKKG